MANFTALVVKESISIISLKVTVKLPYWNKRPSWAKCDVKTRDRGEKVTWMKNFVQEKPLWNGLESASRKLLWKKNYSQETLQNCAWALTPASHVQSFLPSGLFLTLCRKKLDHRYLQGYILWEVWEHHLCSFTDAIVLDSASKRVG